jgi:cation diffusion facilitator family transporter
MFVEVLRNAFNHLSGRVAPHQISPASFVVMLVTVGVNLFVVSYESRAAERLGSEVLMADSIQTRGDVWTSLTVIAALVGVRLGLPILDPLAALAVAGFIGWAGYQIARATTRILSDRMVMAESDLEEVVLSVPGVLGCHQIRTRGSSDHVFLDLHVWLPPEMHLQDAHALSHVVKDRLLARYPQIADAIIHIEPPPPAPQ